MNETPANKTWTDQQFDTVLANVLRFGVLLSALVVSCGGIAFLVRHGLEHPSYRVFHGEPDTLKSIHGIVSDAWQFSGGGIIQLGLLLLVATPIARVVFSIAGFIRQRDWLYVTITFIVLGLLTYSLLGG